MSFVWLTMIQNREKQQFLTFKKLGPEKVWYLCLKNVCNDLSIIKIAAS